MKIKSLCEIFDIEFKAIEYELVICEDPKKTYDSAVNLLRTQDTNHHDSKLEITRFQTDGQEVKTKFVNYRNPDSLRGMTLHRVYIEENIEDSYLENSILKPALTVTGGKIIKKT